MKKILIVDDEDVNRYLLKLYLSKHNFIRLEAENGKEAVDISLKEDIDLIFMDISMPVMNGIDATIEIKKNKPDLPIIAITGYSFDDYNNLDCFDIKLRKPVNMKIINDIVKDYLL